MAQVYQITYNIAINLTLQRKISNCRREPPCVHCNCTGMDRMVQQEKHLRKERITEGGRITVRKERITEGGRITVREERITEGGRITVR